ncbi:MAG: hypothetical protein R3E39_09175 [Anaerolineae bacterium]
MATKTMSESSSNGYVRVVTLGAIGGIVGGMVFGMMMAMMDSLPMVGMLIGQQNAVVGFIVHMAISVFIGATFRTDRYPPAEELEVWLSGWYLWYSVVGAGCAGYDATHAGYEQYGAAN